MMTLARAGTAAIALLVASGAGAKEYVDYTPAKGVWRINAVEVQPSHVDEYLTGLRKSQVPAFDIMKKHGIIDDYRYIVREGYSKDAPNVLVEVHFTSFAMLDSDKARDTMIEDEIHAKFSEADGKIAVAGYEKFRQIVESGLWTEVVMVK